MTAEIVKLKPDVKVLMVDFSDEMIRRSSERFGANKNITVVKRDLNLGISGISDESKIRCCCVLFCFTSRGV